MDLGLAGRACIVTGATRGIGLAVARLLHREGAELLLVARDQARVADLAAELGSHFIAVDVTSANLDLARI